MMAIMIAAASDARVQTPTKLHDGVLEYCGSDEILLLSWAVSLPSIQINSLIDLKFIANKMTTETK